MSSLRQFWMKDLLLVTSIFPQDVGLCIQAEMCLKGLCGFGIFQPH